jgi:glucokinase
MHYTVSIDIGGTTFSYIIFKDRNIYYKSKKFQIKKYNNYKTFVNDLVLLFKNQIKDIKNLNKIGIACPGPLDSKSGTILNPPNLKMLHNVNIKDEFKKYFEIEHVMVENDANIYTLGFYNNLKDKNENDIFLGITLGTGIGFGIIINGKLFRGSYGMAGEYEFSPILNNLTWADLIGKKFFKKITKEIFNKELSPKEIFDLSEKKQIYALKIWEIYGNNVGLCLSHVISMLNPNYISIGGGISKANKYFHKFMIETLKKKCLIFDKNLINISYDKDISNIYYGWFDY